MTTAVPSRVGNAFRAIEGALLATHVLLATRYLRVVSLQLMVPVQDHFFPAALRHPAIVLAAFFGPMITEVIVLDRPTRGAMKWAAAVEVAGAAGLLLHQATYFYAPWVIVFWSGLLLVWMAWSGARDGERAANIGPFLAQLLIAFVFLGAAVGKWTAGYWSGDVFYDIFFARHPSFIYAHLRAWFDDTMLHVIARWFSRAAVLVETSMALVLVLPARLASTVSIAAALGFWLTSSDLFDVSLPLVGVAIAGRMLASPSPGSPHQNS